MATQVADDKVSVKDRIKSLGAGVDVPTFEQILEMDDSPDDREFSQSLFSSFFAQAQETFDKMEAAIEIQDLEELSSLSHFLKGSSATLGLLFISQICEKLQQYGKLETEDGRSEPNRDLCLSRIKHELSVVQQEVSNMEKALQQFFHSA